MHPAARTKSFRMSTAVLRDEWGAIFPEPMSAAGATEEDFDGFAAPLDPEDEGGNDDELWELSN